MKNMLRIRGRDVLGWLIFVGLMYGAYRLGTDNPDTVRAVADWVGRLFA